MLYDYVQTLLAKNWNVWVGCWSFQTKNKCIKTWHIKNTSTQTYIEPGYTSYNLMLCQGQIFILHSYIFCKGAQNMSNNSNRRLAVLTREVSELKLTTRREDSKNHCNAMHDDKMSTICSLYPTLRFEWLWPEWNFEDGIKP